MHPVASSSEKPRIFFSKVTETTDLCVSIQYSLNSDMLTFLSSENHQNADWYTLKKKSVQHTMKPKLLPPAAAAINPPTPNPTVHDHYPLTEWGVVDKTRPATLPWLLLLSLWLLFMF